MFHLDVATKHTLAHMNVRSEKHGTEHETAVDLKLMASMPSSVLDILSPGMRADFYDRDTDGGWTKLKHKLFLPIGWGEEHTGRAVTLDYGLGDDGTPELDFEDGRTSNLRLIGAKVNKFKFTPQDGGSVLVEYRVQVSKVEGAAVSLLSTLLRRSVWVIMPKPDEAHPVQTGDAQQQPANAPDDLVSKADDQQGGGDGQASTGEGGAGTAGDGVGAGGPPDNDPEAEAFIAAHTVRGAAAAAEASKAAAGGRRGTRRPS